MKELFIKSTLDGSMQPSLFHCASESRRPLIVGLHTWSFDRFNQEKVLLPLAQKYDFNLILPEFRGPNLSSNPEPLKACGSDFAVRDIEDAVDFAVGELGCDGGNVFLYGQSGGGFMALLMAGLRPDLFKAVSAFVPICDLAAWAEENPTYGVHVRACCGDDREEMARRSPISHLSGLARSNTKIFHGKYDSCVPVTQSLRLYSRLMEEYPSARVFLDIFDGGHQSDMEAAEHWICTQYKKSALSNVTG